jgi:nucleoside-diphosphate-sugar epimerase
MMLKGKKVLLVGGAGFIGHHLALELARRGAAVEVADALQGNNLLALSSADMPPGQRDLYLRMVHERLALLREARIPLQPVDARDGEALRALVERLRPHALVHLAAVSSANRANKDPHATFDHSLRTLQNALDAARGAVEHFVYFSSSMVYGNFRSEEVDEDHPLEPLGIYGALKLAGERMVIAHGQVFDLDWTIVRPSALYGPRCVSRRVGQVFIENALAGLPLCMAGDGEERVDFTWIEDLVDGVCRVIERPAARNRIFNLTYGAAGSLGQLAAAVQREFPEVRVERVARDRLMPLRGTLCVDRARELLDYAPRTPLEAGVPKYVEWYRRFVGPVSAARPRRELRLRNAGLALAQP